ncbi:hypothetical protein Tco_0165219, partial [Tanacetum coccineum]
AYKTKRTRGDGVVGGNRCGGDGVGMMRRWCGCGDEVRGGCDDGDDDESGGRMDDDGGGGGSRLWW